MRIDRVKLIAEMARQEIQAKDLAKLAGVSRSSITSLRSGKSAHESTIRLVAQALNVSIEELQ